MQIVIDTNVLVSAFYFSGTPRKILLKWIEGEIEVIGSLAIVEEYIRVLEDFGKKRGQKIAKFATQHIVENTTILKVGSKRKFSRDSDDDKFVNCALAAKSKYLITGDKDLLVLKKISNVEIVTPKEFLSKL